MQQALATRAVNSCVNADKVCFGAGHDLRLRLRLSMGFITLVKAGDLT
jgi:hypothetical protein